jgi:hypothetical protein
MFVDSSSRRHEISVAEQAILEQMAFLRNDPLANLTSDVSTPFVAGLRGISVRTNDGGATHPPRVWVERR